ncbi:MAG: putative lipid II flippase FtsW [Candidatus Sericytochromatia bacterium]|nr:putative lipid II flippase FtsW [Candidatus Sericytochromatia bacterium]
MSTKPSSKPSNRPDVLLLAVALALTLLGLVTILSASGYVAQQNLHDGAYFFKRQAAWAGLGLIAMGIGATARLDWVKRLIRPAVIGTTLLLLATHLPGIGVNIKGANRWLHIGPMSLQPSEPAKLVLILFAALVLSHPSYRQLNWKERLEVLVPGAGLVILVLIQPDLGTAMVMSWGLLAVYIAAGLSWVKLGGLLSAATVGILLMASQIPYQKARLVAYMDPWSDARGIGFHLVQSLLAIGSGGIFGEGIGQSMQKLFYLPEGHTDFIFAVFAEETGLVGTIGLLILLSLFASRGFRIARKARDPFAKLLASGLTGMIVGQALLNISVVTASVPTTGIPLPFISFGGSSLCLNLLCVGLLLNISRHQSPRLALVAKEPLAHKPAAGPVK